MRGDQQVRIAVVGYGYWGSKHVRVLSSIPDAEVTVVDPCADRLAEASARYPVAGLALTIDEVLGDIDAAVVATPPPTHAALAYQLLEAGCHTLVEKPMTTSIADGELLVETADRRRMQLMIGNTFEYNPAVWKLREIVQSGSLGRVLYIDTQRLSLGRYQNDINVIWDLAPHDISIASYLLDEMPTTATAWAHCNVGGRVADVAYLRFGFARAKVHAFVHVSWLSPDKVRKVTVVGERKMVVYDDVSDSDRIRIYDKGVDPTEIAESALADAMPVSYRTGDITSPYIPFSEPLLVQDQHFIDCVRTGVACKTPGSRGLEIVRVLASTDTSASSGDREGVHLASPDQLATTGLAS
jgi:predicted dehydrogenase